MQEPTDIFNQSLYGPSTGLFAEKFGYTTYLAFLPRHLKKLSEGRTKLKTTGQVDTNNN